MEINIKKNCNYYGSLVNEKKIIVMVDEQIWHG